MDLYSHEILIWSFPQTHLPCHRTYIHWLLLIVWQIIWHNYPIHQLIWSMEYNPHLFTIYESNASPNRNQDESGNEDFKKYGKFERKCLKSGRKDQQANLSIFLVASILKAKNKRLLLEAKGLDDLVKVSRFPPIFYPIILLIHLHPLLSHWLAFLADVEWHNWWIGCKESMQWSIETSREVLEQGLSHLILIQECYLLSSI